MPELAPLRTCVTCALQPTCAMAAQVPLWRQRKQLREAAPVPMPCGGDLWEQGEARGTSRRRHRLFEQYNPRPASERPQAKQEGAKGLDELELP